MFSTVKAQSQKQKGYTSILLYSGKFGTKMWYNLSVHVQDLHSYASLLVIWLKFSDKYFSIEPL